MLQARPCPHLIWTASISMIRILRQARLRTLRLSLLRVVSVEGLQSTSSRTCVTCFTALAPHSTSVLRSLCSLTDQCHTHSPSHRAVNPKGCSPPRTLFRTARVFLSRKTLARRDRAAVLRLHKPSAHKVQACGLASSRHDNIVYTILKAQRRLNNNEREGSINAFIHCSYFTHSHTLYTPVYIFLLNLRTSHVCILLLGVSTDLICYFSSGIPIWVTFGVSTSLPTWRYIYSRKARL